MPNKKVAKKREWFDFKTYKKARTLPDAPVVIPAFVFDTIQEILDMGIPHWKLYDWRLFCLIAVRLGRVQFKEWMYARLENRVIYAQGCWVGFIRGDK